MPPQIQVKNLSKVFRSRVRESGPIEFFRSLVFPQFKEKNAVDSVSFEIERGELVGFIGANGAGKTTTLKMLSGLLYPTAGQVRVMGFDPFERNPEFLKNISLLMGQRRQLWWDLPVIDSLKLNKEIYDIPDHDFKTIIGELTSLFDAERLLDSPPRTLSLGERMKCELIAAILHKPKVLFLDEPTIGLDIVMQRQVREFIKSFNKKYDSTIMLTSHYMEDVKELCARVLIIQSGVLVYDGPLADLAKKGVDFKLLTVVFTTPISRQEIEKYGSIESNSPTQSIIKVPSHDVRAVSAAMMAHLPVDDIAIGEPSVEDIIRGIFAKKAQ